MASSSSPPRLWMYDVFLSFRGTDTRKSFVCHLYRELHLKGVVTFKDDKRLEQGDSIPEELARGIQESRFAIVVLSEDYASSRWCLEELRMIMELQRMQKLIVVPVFYGVFPSDVRHQTGSFAESFKKYTDPEMAEKVQIWKEALTQVANLSGELSGTFRDDAMMIDVIVGDVSHRLLSMRPRDFNDKVGMAAHMERMNPLLNIESVDEVRIIGIWGMGGIGKTAIARYLYERISNGFPEGHCFLETVKEDFSKYSLVYLQKKLLSGIFHEENWNFSDVEQGSVEIKARLRSLKVLVVLDGVDDLKQLHALAKETSRSGPGSSSQSGPESYGWFGPGSRIIITTRDKGLLRSIRVERVCKVECLGDDDALLVFKQAAFGGGLRPSDGYEELSVRACRLARGLPSALEAFGLYLSEMDDPEDWQDALCRLERAPHESMMEIFKISYDRLGRQDKIVFLHVACLFNGYRQRLATALLDDGESEVRLGIRNLADKSLIDISTDECITMHDLVEQTGRQFVRQESENNPRTQRILWDHQEIRCVLEYNTGTDLNEGIALHMCEIPDEWSMSGSVFKPMHSLKFLKFYMHLDGGRSTLQLTTGINLHDRNLRLLHWDAYPMKTLPSRFRLHCLVELSLRFSNLEKLWDGTSELKNLRRLDLTGSKKLKKLPDLSRVEKLEELRIRGCTRLKLTPEYIDSLSHLEIFDYDNNLQMSNVPQEGSRIRSWLGYFGF